jgi:phage-related protein
MLMRLTPTTSEAYDEFDRLGLISFDAAKALNYLAENGVKPASTATKDVVDAFMTFAAESVNAKVGSEQANKAFREMTFNAGALSSSFYDSNGNLKSMSDIAGILQESLKGLTAEQRQVALNTMFGSDAIRAANILYKDGADGINKMNAAMKEITADQVAAERLNNLNGTLEQLKGSVETLAISLGTALLPFVKSFAEGIQGLVDKFNNLSPAMQSFIAIGSAVAAAIALVTGPILLLIGYIPQIVAGFTALGPIVSAVGAAFTALTGPIGLAIAAIVAIGAALVALYKNNEDFRKFVLETWDKIKTGIKAAVDFISKIVNTVISEVVKFVKSQLGDLRKFWDENGAAIVALVKLAFGQIVDNIKLALGIIKGVFEAVWPVISGVVKIAWEAIKLVVSNVLDAILGLITVFLKVIQGDWKGAWEAVKDIVKNTMENAIAFLRNIDLVQIGKDIVNGLIKGIGSMAGALADRVKSLASGVTDNIKNVLGINSPSKVTTQLGEWTGEGLALGMQRSLGDIKRQTAAMAAAAVPMMDSVPFASPRARGASGGASNTYNFERMLEGAIFNVRGDNDVKQIAREIFTLQQTAARGAGAI